LLTSISEYLILSIHLIGAYKLVNGDDIVTNDQKSILVPMMIAWIDSLTITLHSNILYVVAFDSKFKQSFFIDKIKSF
jgi:hypothetical protein